MEKLIIASVLFISLNASCQDSVKTNNANHSWEIKMTKPGEPGKKFTLDITVLDISTKQPVKDAEVFAFQTNYKGDYENDPKTGIAKIHGTAWSNEQGAIRFFTIYPRGYYDSPTGEHIHFRTKARGYSGGGTDLSFWEFQQKILDHKNPIVSKVYLETLEEKNGELFGKAIIYMKKS
jgi:protocatechuate 3,4-dioxygenase beta subunit